MLCCGDPDSGSAAEHVSPFRPSFLSPGSLWRVWILHLRLWKDPLDKGFCLEQRYWTVLLLTPCTDVFFFLNQPCRSVVPYMVIKSCSKFTGKYIEWIPYSISRGMSSVCYCQFIGGFKVNIPSPDSIMWQQNHWDASVSYFTIVQYMTERWTKFYQLP